MTRLTLVRHGQAHSNHPREIVAGPATCTGLTEVGFEQALRVACRLREEAATRAITAVYATPLARAADTAEAIADALGLPVQFQETLRYPIYGFAEGRLWSEVHAEFWAREGSHPARMPDQPLAENAESMLEFGLEHRRGLHELIERHRGEHVVFACSAENVIDATLMFLDMGANSRERVTFGCDHTSLTTWQWEDADWAEDGTRWRMLRINDASHLPPTQQRILAPA